MMYPKCRVPRSSFMGFGGTSIDITASPKYVPVVEMTPPTVSGQSPPFAQSQAGAKPNYLMYAVLGGGALVVAYLFMRKG